ncbi:transient receptor potential cation channel protein painless-like isoform X2 [Rhynchophorus ferrugineus]|uniref:transient receptor potential cation channel protein painless-like isoform X2 n=1 Tax=Rhynchophorus ferrugineus TaxID=354439 RepID=UPI003FCD1D84
MDLRNDSKEKASEELLDIILSNKDSRRDQSRIKEIIESYPDLLSNRYSIQCSNTPLLIACSNPGVKPEVIKTLLGLGADLMERRCDDWQALHCAANNARLDILKLLLDKNGNIINNLAEEQNALQILVRYGDSNSTDFYNCADLLVKKGINLNQCDKKGRTSLHWAKKREYNNIIDMIEKASKTKTPVDPQIVKIETLRECLRKRDEEDFIAYFDKFYESSSSIIDELLQFSCEKGLVEAAEHLLYRGADPNRILPNKKTPIEIAAIKGYSELKRYKVNIDKEYEGYLLLNGHDDVGYTPLHYALRFADSDTIEQLLSLGSSLGSSSIYGGKPVENIRPGVLKKHLDNSINPDNSNSTSDTEIDMDQENFKLKINYNSLIPPFIEKKESETTNDSMNNDIEMQECEQNNLLNRGCRTRLVDETEVLYLLSKETKFKHLLKHPVVTTFICFKWQQFRYIFWLHLLFYTFCYLSLVFSILSWRELKYEPLTYSLWIALFIVFIRTLVLIIILIRKGRKVKKVTFKYLKHISYIFDLLLSILISVMVRTDFDSSEMKLASVFAILLVSVKLICAIGYHQSLSVYVIMIKIVLKDIFKLLLWLCIPLWSFSLIFYLIFATPKNVEETGRSESYNGSFDDPYLTMFKTMIMMTGELEANNVDFSSFPFMGRIIIGLFIIVIIIGLMNLLIGTAVSDIQAIRKDAELSSCIATVQYLNNIEYIFNETKSTLSSLNCCERFINALFNYQEPTSKESDCNLFTRYERTLHLNAPRKNNISMNKRTISEIKEILWNRNQEEK